MKEKSAYAKAGVDLEAAKEATERMKDHVELTYNPNVLSIVGSFGGMLDVSFLRRYENPVLVFSIDGAGTKTIISVLMNIWSVGQCIVNHCINDILTCGAQPIAFLDYVASSNLKPETLEKIVAQMAIACRQADIPLIGGETAEMPDVYKDKQHDIVGSIVGVVEKDKIIDGSKITKGDILWGLPSNGLHTNGYSLARKAFLQTFQYRLSDRPPDLSCSVGEELIKVHKSYLRPVSGLIKNAEVHGIAHITGGGLFDNIERLLPNNLCAEINQEWTIPPVFRSIQEIEKVSNQEMRRVFNLGIGMVFIVLGGSPVYNWIPGAIQLGRIRKARSEKESQKVIFTY